MLTPVLLSIPCHPERSEGSRSSRILPNYITPIHLTNHRDASTPLCHSEPQAKNHFPARGARSLAPMTTSPPLRITRYLHISPPIPRNNQIDHSTVSHFAGA